MTGFDSVDYDIQVDMNNDGTYETTLSSGTLAKDEPLNFEPGDHPWRITARSAKSGELTVALNRVIASGSGNTAATADLTYEEEQVIPTRNITSDGKVEESKMVQGNLSVNGQEQTVYTIDKPSGRPITVAYNSDGSSTVTAADIRQASVQNSKENSDLLDKLGEISDKLGGPAASPSPTPDPGGGPTPTPIPAPEAGPYIDAATELLQSAIDPVIDTSGVAPATAPSYSPSVTSDSWLVHVPYFGTKDLNPLSDPVIFAISQWIRVFMILCITAIVIFKAYKFIWEIESFSTIQPFGTTLGVKANIEAWIAAASASWGIAGVALAVLCWVILFALSSIVVQLVLGALLTAPSLISGVLSWDSPTLVFPLGGGGVFEQIGQHLSSGPSEIVRGISFVNAFFPISHALISLANILSMRVYGTWILRAWATIKRAIPS